MDITSILKINDKPSHNWPNIQTGITSTCIVANIACALLKTSLTPTLGVNIPIRAASVIMALYNKDYCKAALNLPAFVVLLLPHGKLISIGIDIISEVINYQKNQRPKPSKSINLGQIASRLPKRLDPTNRLNACKILGIKEEEIGNKELIALSYDKKASSLKESQAGLLKGKYPNYIMADQIGILISDMKIAYETLKNE